MKRLVVFCDGTWDKPVGPIASSNVCKLHDAIEPTDPDGVQQLPWYHSGVGTGGGSLGHWFGGMFGLGLSADIKLAYAWLVGQYQPGDEVFLIGFSRGAYTVRSLAGLIRNSGILRPDRSALVDDAFTLYRDRSGTSGPRSGRARDFRQQNSYEARIRFIGVWDTVGALGIPVVPVLHPIAEHFWGFHDVQLSSWVDYAVQALAIDEQRKPFVPTLWQPAAPPEPGQPGNQSLEQAWFAGCHCDVGGGNTPPDLSDITLTWMRGHAENVGLAFRTDPPPPTGNPAGQLHQSCTGKWKILGSASRVIGQLGSGMDPSVRQRYERMTYAPRNLIDYLSSTHSDWPPPGTPAHP